MLIFVGIVAHRVGLTRSGQGCTTLVGGQLGIHRQEETVATLQQTMKGRRSLEVLRYGMMDAEEKITDDVTKNLQAIWWRSRPIVGYL